MSLHVFLQAMRDDPADDLARLACADYFEEQGDAPRGEMIRLQIELGRGADRPRRLALLRRLRELIVAHRDAWLGPLRQLAPDAVLERGFVTGVRIGTRALVDHADAILGQHPITWLELDGERDAVAGLADCPGLDGVRALRHRESRLVDRQAAALAASPYLRRLRVLDLDSNGLTEAGLTALINGAHWRLEELSLRRNEVRYALAAFVQSPAPPALRRLDLSGNRVGTAGARWLAGPSWLSGLERLSLAYTDLQGDDVELLAASPHLASVGQLLLYQSALSADESRRLRGRYGPRVQV